MVLHAPRQLGRAVTTAAIFCTVGVALWPAHAGDDNPLVVVVNTNNPISDITSKELRQIFLRQKTEWSDGTPIVALVWPPGNPERELFDQKVLRMTPVQVGSYWVDQQVRGAEAPPTAVPSVLLMQRVIEQKRGGIGYVRFRQATRQVKVISVDGVSATDRDYPLGL